MLQIHAILKTFFCIDEKVGLPKLEAFKIRILPRFIKLGKNETKKIRAIAQGLGFFRTRSDTIGEPGGVRPVNSILRM